MIDVEKLGKFLVEKKVFCPACNFNKFIIVENEYCLPKWLPAIGGLDSQRTFVTAVVQCENCGYLLLFNAINNLFYDNTHK